VAGVNTDKKWWESRREPVTRGFAAREMVAFIRLTIYLHLTYNQPTNFEGRAAMKVNPMAGPDYIRALTNAVEENRTAYCTPPRTGGRQMSVRLDDFLTNHVEAIAELSGWNRSEVLYAIAHQGLYDLYEKSPSSIDLAVARIMEKFKARHATELGG
jgi:hypothetical protein